MTGGEAEPTAPMDPQHRKTAAGRLSLLTKLGYGAGGITDFLFMAVPGNMALPVFAKQLGMDTGLLGAAVAIPKVFATISDSVVGSASDNTRSRWGRRRPFILVAAAIGALMLPCLWFPPAHGGNWGLFAYISVLTTVYTMIYSAFSVPYQALGYELTKDYDDRTRVQAWKGYMSGIGFFMAPWFFWFCTRDCFHSLVEGTRWLSVIMGAVMLSCAVVVVLACREGGEAQRQEKVGLRRALGLTFRNRPFLLLQGACLMMTLGVCCGGTVGFYLLLDYVCHGDEKFFGLLTGVSGTVSNVMTYVGMALGVWLSTHFGKKMTAVTGMLAILAGIALLVVFLAPSYSWLPLLPVQYHPWLTMIPGIVMNLGLQSCNLMFGSMTADICDEDELETGLRREGAYVAVAGVMNKTMGIVLLVLAGFMPYLVGYTVMTVKPTMGQLVGMKWLLIGAQGLFTAIALVFLMLYPITRARSEQTRRRLDERKSRS